jgi:hypothetical protein
MHERLGKIHETVAVHRNETKQMHAFLKKKLWKYMH